VEGLGFPLFVFLAWVVFSILRGAAKSAGELQRKQRGSARPLPESLPGINADFLEMLRQLERARGGAEPAPRQLPTPRPEDEPEFVENVQSLEGEVRRPAREEISLDSASEQAIRRRREAAARRDMPRTAADHAAFDARVRAEPDKTATAGATPPAATARLQHALIWNEILGRPVALRDEPNPRHH
jgi:hypothetical protein